MKFAQLYESIDIWAEDDAQKPHLNAVVRTIVKNRSLWNLQNSVFSLYRRQYEIEGYLEAAFGPGALQPLFELPDVRHHLQEMQRVTDPQVVQFSMVENKIPVFYRLCVVLNTALAGACLLQIMLMSPHNYAPTKSIFVESRDFLVICMYRLQLIGIQVAQHLGLL